MTKGIGKYQTWRAFDTSIGADAAASINLFSSEADEDMTIVGVRASIKLGTDSDPAEGIGGYVNLVVVRRGGSTPAFGTATDANWLSNSTANSINDDPSDHWAIEPFLVVGRHIDHVLLAPTTKRVLRKGEKLEVSVRAQNFTNAAQFLKTCATITVFTLEQ